MSIIFILENKAGILIAERSESASSYRRIWQGETLTGQALCDIISLCRHSTAEYISCDETELIAWEATIKQYELSQ